MSSKPNPDLVAEHAAQEIHNDALHLAGMLEGEVAVMGAKELAKGDMLELVARHWNDRNPIYGPQHTPFREWLLLAMGPTNFLTLFREGVAKGMLHPDPVAPLDLGLGANVPSPAMPPTLAVNPSPPQLPGGLMRQMTNAQG